MSDRLRCPSCGTEQESRTVAEGFRCAICGSSLSAGASPPPLRGGAARSAASPTRPPEVDITETADGALADHAARLPEEAPPLRSADLDAIAAGEKRSSTLLAFVPGWGLWRITRSPLHDAGEKLVLSVASAALTVALGIAISMTIPSQEELTAETHQRAREQMASLEQLLDRYRLEHGEDPSPEVWRESASMGDLRFWDPWGRIYLYESNDREARIWTYGRDGVEGGRREDADLEARIPRGAVTNAD